MKPAPRPRLRLARWILAGVWLLACPAMADTPDCAAPPAGDDGWPVAAPASVGLDPAVLCAAGPRFEAWKQADLHAVVVVRSGKLVYEHYFSGPDEQMGRPVPNAVFDKDTLHDMRSVSKSITSLVLGIGIGRGWIGGIDRPVLPFFPEYAEFRSVEKDRISIRDLLTMSSGLAWNEMIPYSDPSNSEERMSQAPDPYRFILEQPVNEPPGTVYNYSGGGAALIAAILHKATGRTLEELARDELFTPLGITEAKWYKLPNGDPRAASGARLRPRDMAKIGELVLNHGRWAERQIVPADYVDAAISPQINGQGLYFYGYQFWLGRSLVAGHEIDWAAAVGLGGQRIFIVPSENMVVVVTAGLYRSDMQGLGPSVALNRYALAAAHADH